LEGIWALFLALVAVGAVLYLSYLFSRYLAVGAAKVNKSKYVKIIDRVVLGQDRLILIAAVGEKYYLLGSTAQSIQILAEIDEKDMTEMQLSEKTTGNPNFKDTLKGLLSKKQGEADE